MKPYDIHAEVKQSQVTAVARSTLAVAEFGPWLGKVYPAVVEALVTRQAGPAGPPFARFHRLADGRFEVEAGFPASRPFEAADFENGEVVPSELPGGQVAVTMHAGSYDQIEPAYQAVAAWVTEHGGEPAGDPWEVYLSGPPTEPDPANWLTQVVQPYHPAG